MVWTGPLRGTQTMATRMASVYEPPSMSLSHAEFTCWQCGVQPAEVVEVTTLAEPQPRYLPGRWPAGDHEHAVNPPSPEDLVDAGAAALARVYAEASR